MTKNLQAGLALSGLIAVGTAAATETKIADKIADQLAAGNAEVVIRLETAPDLGQARHIPDRWERLAWVVRRLKSHAAKTQGPVLQTLRGSGVEPRSYWITNSLVAQLDATTARRIAELPQVVGIESAHAAGIGVASAEPSLPKSGVVPTGPEPNLEVMNVPAAWDLGHTGEGVVVGVLDTGVAYTHNALRSSYRGYDGADYDHDYNWFDVFKTDAQVTISCPPDQPKPCDDDGHGTRVTGLIVGSEPGLTTGPAPNAAWIACRGLGNPGFDPQLSVERPMRCWQWLMEPTRVDGSDPDLSMAPDIINNSFACQPDVPRCDEPGVYRDAVRALDAAGFLQVGSASLRGPACETIVAQPGTYEEMLTVGGMTNTFSIIGPTGRGPVIGPGGEILVKPDLVAPGSDLTTTVDRPFFGFGKLFGSEPATAQTSGVAALLLSANPALRGKPALTRHVLRTSALPLLSGHDFRAQQDCRGLPGNQSPNAVYGHGSVDALSAVQMADPLVGEISGFWLDPENPGTGIHLQVTSDAEGQPLVVITWYTFDAAGDPVWRIGSASTRPGAGAVAVELVQGTGTGFGAELDPASVNLSTWGTARFRALGCGVAEFTVTPAGGAPIMADFSRLTPALAGLPCRYGTDDPALLTAYRNGEMSMATGRRTNLFLDASLPGQGFSVEVAEADGAAPTLVVAWYAFEDGAPLWLIGSAPLAGVGAPVELPLVSAADGGTTDWGTLTWQFDADCTAATVSYASADGEHTGTLALTALTRGVRDNECGGAVTR